MTLEARARELAVSLIPASADADGPKQIAACVSALLMAYPSMRMTADESRMTAKMFVKALEDQPLWAIQQACSKWMRGEIQKGNPAFPPSAPELRALAVAQAIDARTQHTKVERILSANVYRLPSQEERDRAIEWFQAVLSETTAVPDDNPHAAPLYQPGPAAPKTPAAHIAPPSISPALRERLAQFAGEAA